MAKFDFPRNPGTDHANPFKNERGENPFGEQTPTAAGDENPYGASRAEALRSGQADDYVTTLPNRSMRVLTFGLLGLVLAMLGVASAAAGVASSGNWTWGISFGIPIQLLGLAVSLPSWIFGASDLKAIRAGAMEAAGRSRTRIGFVLGIVGVLIGIVPVLGWCALLIVDALNV